MKSPSFLMAAVTEPVSSTYAILMDWVSAELLGKVLVGEKDAIVEQGHDVPELSVGPTIVGDEMACEEWFGDLVINAVVADDCGFRVTHLCSSSHRFRACFPSGVAASALVGGVSKLRAGFVLGHAPSCDYGCPVGRHARGRCGLAFGISRQQRCQRVVAKRVTREFDSSRDEYSRPRVLVPEYSREYEWTLLQARVLASTRGNGTNTSPKLLFKQYEIKHFILYCKLYWVTCTTIYTKLLVVAVYGAKSVGYRGRTRKPSPKRSQRREPVRMRTGEGGSERDETNGRRRGENLAN
ncbi:hypothetical protein EDB89DRAFT_2242109 [Lactarius sanguifluus]|nr:hypothetical protein EDB89DRAFT_2242109 [Lactarius sanguifluus]